MEPPGDFFAGYYRNRSANKYQHVRARSRIADKLAVLRRVGEQHESYQRVCITASINNAIFTSSIRESCVDTCTRALVCDSVRGRCIAVTLSTACGRYTVVNKAETGLAETYLVSINTWYTFFRIISWNIQWGSEVIPLK